MPKSMSLLSTDDTTRDELAEKEADEFDFNYAYVFGSQARYKADNCNGRYGTVIASYNTEHGGEIANVVFVSMEQPLVLIPSSFFRPGRELLRLFTSNNQRRKRQENFALMDCVQLGVNEHHEVTWVAKASRHNTRLELFSDNFIGIDTIGVLKPAEVKDDQYFPRRLWTEKIGYFDNIPEDITSEYLTDVAYHVRFHLVTHPNLLDEQELRPETLQIEHFNPTCEFQFCQIQAVDDVRQEIVEHMEWNIAKQDNLVNVFQESDEQWAFGLERDKPKPERSQAIKNVRCLTTTKTELYTPRHECDRDVMIRVPWRHYWDDAGIAPGTFVTVTLVYSKLNDWYIVVDYEVDE